MKNELLPRFFLQKIPSVLENSLPFFPIHAPIITTSTPAAFPRLYDSFLTRVSCFPDIGHLLSARKCRELE